MPQYSFAPVLYVMRSAVSSPLIGYVRIPDSSETDEFCSRTAGTMIGKSTLPRFGRSSGAIERLVVHDRGRLALGRVVARRRAERALERLADDHAQHRGELGARRHLLDLGVAEELRHRVGCGLGAVDCRVVEHARAEVVERRRVPAVGGLVADLAQEVRGVVGSAGDRVPVLHLDGDLRRRRSRVRLRLAARRDGDGLLGCVHVGIEETARRPPSWRSPTSSARCSRRRPRAAPAGSCPPGARRRAARSSAPRPR